MLDVMQYVQEVLRIIRTQIFLKKLKKIPLGRLAKADEYQSTIIWMLSEKSSYLNGSIITIDGGRTSW